MGPFRKLLLVGVGVIALYGVQACANDELNPQPLPPQTGSEGTSGGTTPEPPADPSKSSSGGDSTNGAGGTPAPQAGDAGAEGGGDAADGGDG